MASERIYNSNLRREHFIAAVQKQFRASKRPVPIDVVCASVASQPAPQFYTTYVHALEMYWKYKKTGRLPMSSPLIQSMYLEIFSRFEARVNELGGRVFYNIVMQDVLDEPAPSYYLEPSNARNYYYRSKRICRNNRRRK